MALSFGILGPLEVREDGREMPLGSGRQRALLALLLVHANELTSSEQLIDELWSGRQPPSAQKALQGYVSQLRRALGADAILTRGSGYVLVPTDTDAAEFERLAKLAAEQDAGDAILTSERALALWRGRAFEEFEYEEWAQSEITRLDELRLAATEQRIEAELELGHHAELVPELEKLVAGHPLRERLRGELMIALYRSGRHADALDVYRQGRQVLHDDLGLEPSPFLVELERSILRHDPELTGPVRRTLPRPPRRRWLPAGAVAAAVGVVVVAAIAIASHGGSAPKVLPNSLVRLDPTTLKPVQVVRVSAQPDLVVASGGFLWVTHYILRDVQSSAIRNAGDRTLTRVDPSTGDATVVGGGLAPCGMTPDPSGDLWVVNCFAGADQNANVVRINARTLAFERTWPLPKAGNFYRGTAYGGGSLWVSNPATRAVTQIDPDTGAAKTIRFTRVPGALAWAGGYGDLWVNNFDDGSITRYHAATGAGTIVDHVAVEPSYPTVDGDTVWAGDWAGPRVERIRAVGPHSVLRLRLPVKHGDAGVEGVAAGAGAVWAATPRDHALWRIDPRTGEVTRIALPYLPQGVTTDGNAVWVTVRRK